MYKKDIKHYFASFSFGNDTGYRYSKGIVNIQINRGAFSIILMQKYDTDKYPFPPFKKNFEYVGEKYLKADKRKIEAIQEHEISLIAYEDKEGNIFKIPYEYPADELYDKTIKGHHLIICISQTDYEFLYEDLRKHFLYSPPPKKDRIGGWEYKYHIQADSMKWIDKKLKELIEHLPDKVLWSLKLDET